MRAFAGTRAADKEQEQLDTTPDLKVSASTLSLDDSCEDLNDAPPVNEIQLKDAPGPESKKQEEEERTGPEKYGSRTSLTSAEEEQAADQLAEDLIEAQQKEEEAEADLEKELAASIEKQQQNEAFRSMGGGLFPFNVFIVCCIAAHALFLALQMDIDFGRADYPIEFAFCTVWVVEVIVNVYWYGAKGYCESAWRRLDGSLAALAVLETWIMPLADLDPFVRIRLMGILRMLRMLRIARLVKLLQVFRELWLLTNGLVRAMSVLGWMMLLMTFIIFSTALVFRAHIGMDCDTRFSDWSDCHALFGSIPRTMFTLFQASTLESWAMVIARPVLEEMPYMVVIFVVYLFFTTFGLFNIMVGAIVEQTMQASAETERKRVEQKVHRQKQEIKELKHIFRKADADRSGTVTLGEFLSICTHEDVQKSFQLLDINVKRKALAKRLFEVLDSSGAGTMRINELLERTWQLMTEGRNLNQDMSLLLMESRHLARGMHKCREQLGVGDPEFASPSNGSVSNRDMMLRLTSIEEEMRMRLSGIEQALGIRPDSYAGELPVTAAV